MTTATNNSHKTAIKRTRVSAPMAKLKEKHLLLGRTLDYGCGRGFDAEHFGMCKYDPYYSPERPVGDFQTITCNFVLNVIEDEDERSSVLRDIQSLLANGFPPACAYITVRTDKKALNGTTKIGTWQGLIELNLPIVQRGSGYVTYLLLKGDEV